MNIEEFEEILNDDDEGVSLLSQKGCNTMKGLLVIIKYLPQAGISSASHDVIYSAGISDLVEAGITKEDAIYLREQNWMIEGGAMACFV